jgi:hypothetical protein
VLNSDESDLNLFGAKVNRLISESYHPVQPSEPKSFSSALITFDYDKDIDLKMLNTKLLRRICSNEYLDFIK